MQNLAIFHESNKDAAYYRQQVSECGILEQIDVFNEGLLEIKGITKEDLTLVYELLNKVENSLNKNVNDPRTRMALNSFKLESKKEPENELVVDTEDHFKDADLDGGVIVEQGKVPTGEPDPIKNTEPTEKVDTTEPDPIKNTDPAEKVDTTEPDPIKNTEPAEKVDTTEPDPIKTTTPTETKKGGRKKKDAE